MFNIENQGVSTYLTYEISDNDIIDALSLGMLTNNKISGVAPMLFTQMDNKKYLKYNISSKISVKQFFKGVVTRKRFLSILSGIANAIIASEEYMVDSSLFVMDSEYIFADAAEGKPVLICLPVENAKFGCLDMHEFFREIVFSTQYDQNENCDYVAKMINYLNGVSAFSISDFKRFVDSLNVESDVSRSVAVVSETSTFSPSPSSTHFSPKTTPVQKPKAQPQPTLVEKSKEESWKSPETQVNLPTKPQNNEGSKSKSEKKVSLVYLLRHYNKETLELYKSQKENKETAKDKKEKNRNIEKKPKSSPKARGSFAIPGVSVENQVQNKIGVEAKTPVPVHNKNENKGINETGTATFDSDVGGTTLLTNAPSGETTLLASGGINVQVRQSAHLIRIKTGETISINKPRFRIGKERSYVDYFIGDNTAISRSHADIISRDGRYYLVDMNSTNGTFVDGMMISSGEEIAIDTGSRIRLANEEFEFEIR